MRLDIFLKEQLTVGRVVDVVFHHQSSEMSEYLE